MHDSTGRFYYQEIIVVIKAHTKAQFRRRAFAVPN